MDAREKQDLLESLEAARPIHPHDHEQIRVVRNAI
jgi:hypothetical protein